MAGSTRGELASSGLDGTAFAAAYQNGQRGAFSASTLEKSGSFRETLDARAMVSGVGTSRNVASSMELSPVSNYLPLEPFSMSEQKYSRQGEIRRALGITVEEHAFGSLQSKSLPAIAVDDVKRLKASLTESMGKARDRAKSFQDSIMKVDKYRNLLLRKRKADLSTDKLSSSNVVKIGQNNQTSADLVIQRLEDRAKNVVPNKRVRSSMAEVRSEGRCTVPPRQAAVVEKEKSILFDKDKNILRGCNGPTEEKMRVLPPGSDGWEKKLKRKRSVGTMVNRGIDGDRDVKQPSQQRPNSDPRPRSSDGIGFRPGLSSGILGSNKIEGSCSTGGNPRTMPWNDAESSSLSNERRERSVGIDKERVISKGGNKLTIREDAHLGNQSSLIKGKASRAPRSGSGVLLNTSTNLPRAAGGLDGWEREQASCLNKVQASPGVANRKRPIPTGSSSPPVTQWIGQRPQKISRTRRANVVSPVSNLDESQFLPEGFGTPDVGRLTTVDSSGLQISRGIPIAPQSKLKDSAPSPCGLSESEDSGAVDNKSKEKGVNSVELEDASPNASNKPTSFIFPTKKNKMTLKEDIRDGVRRQGRSGRGSTQSKAFLPSPKEKTESPDTNKPLKNGKNGSDRNESRIGRPPSKKMSERKPHNRTGNIINGGSSDLTGDSDDDREELQAAALAARSASYNASSSSFWKKMEPFFAFLTSEDISYVKNQIHFAEELDASLSDKPCANHDGEAISEGVSSPRSSCLIGQVRDNSARRFGPVPSSDLPQTTRTGAGKFGTNRLFEKMIPLSQMLLSSFITQDETEMFDYSSETKTLLQPPNGFCSYDMNAHTEKKDSKSFIKSEFEVALDYKNHLGDTIPCNGFMNSSNSRHSDTQAFMSGDESLMENNSVMHLDNGYISEYRETNIKMQQLTDNVTLQESQFELMSLSDRILMELHSIGLFPETVPELAEDDTGEIDKEIAEFKMKLCHQVKRRKLQLDKLDKAIQDAKEAEERNLECLAINKLVEMACKKLMGGRGGSSHKSNKISKQLALSFANRTLTRCRKFEETGHSCFSEPALWDLLSATVNTNHGISLNITEKHGLGNKLDRGSMDSYHSQIPEQSLVKNEFIAGRGKKKEILLDDVTSGASRSMSTPNTIPSGAKWKRTERDRDQNREGLAKNSSVKVGRPSLSSSRGERKTKAKPKQKMAELSASGNGLGRITETTNFASSSLRECSEAVNNGTGQEVDMTHDSSKEAHEGIFTNLPLHGIDSIDELDVAEGLDGQGQDLATWLNVVDDDILLQDHDLVGLQIPMDDLSDIKLSF